MKEATPSTGKLIPPTLNKRAANNNKGPKQTTCQEVRTAVYSVISRKKDFILFKY